MTDATPIEPATALRNVLAMLQSEPAAYKLFGVWWWPVKALLRAAGYTADNLFYLGAYVDHETAALVPHGGLQETLAAAFEEYGHNATLGRPGGVVEGPDGELVTIYDADAGL